MEQKSPDKITGLKCWVDASDRATINNGTVTQGQNVFKIVDKASGLIFRNGYGSDGPTYSVNQINGKGAITFNYYTTPNSIQAKGLWASNATTFASGTYSLYVVNFPYLNRQRNTDGAGNISQQNLWLFSIINNLPSSTLTAYSPHRYLVYRSIGSGQTNSNPVFREDSDLTTTGGVNTVQFDKILITDTDVSNSLPPSDPRFIYGKTNIIGVRNSDNVKRFTFLRKDYMSDENFQTQTISKFSVSPQQGFVPTSGGPWATIGAVLPNANTRIVEGVPGPISTEYILNGVSPTITTNVYAFEGYFCELLYWDRLLSRSESNAVEAYLKKKWIG